ncbi:MAG: nuclear mRNA export, poly(A)+RNA binding protein, partial [Pleopsidium flavum]
MVQQNSTPPSGPRLTRRSRGHDKSPPLSSSAGIRKRRNGPLRVDKDGDLEMEAAAESGRGRGSRGRGSDQNAGGAAGRSGARTGTSRGGISSAATQKAILRSMGSGAATVRGPRKGLNVSKIIREATDQGSGWEKGEGLRQINVTGWRRSMAASNSDGGVNDLLAFLKRRAAIPGRPASEASKIIKSRIEGDTLVIFVKPEDMSRILHLNTYTFAGATLAIEERAGTARRTDSITTREASENTLDMRQKLTAILNRRYNSELKLLNLSSLGNDPELVKMGMFDTTSTESKFFPALMKVSDLIFNSPQQKREAVVSVTLADNMLSDIKSVTTLSQAFPDLKNLDLSNNKLKDLRSLDGWRWKFRHLDHL